MMARKSFNGMIENEGSFPPEPERYHAYIGLSCPFAHRVNLMRHLKGLTDIIDISIPRLRPKEDGIPEWTFSNKEREIPGATTDKLFGCTIIREVYELLDPEYQGRFTIPMLVDTRTRKIVNNESAEIMRNLSTAFNSILPPNFAAISLYPEDLRAQIDALSPVIQNQLATGVYKAGFNPQQKSYEENLVIVFAMLNKIEGMMHRSRGPYLLGSQLTELDLLLYPCLIRFDTVYHQHLKCNLGMIRYDYPVLHAYLQHLYWNVPGFRETTNFEHIKENYTKAHRKVNPTGITPLGPYPDIKPITIAHDELKPGGVFMPRVMEQEVDFPDGT